MVLVEQLILSVGMNDCNRKGIEIFLQSRKSKVNIESRKDKK